MTFLVQHWIGTQGMPRRVASYPDLPAHMTVLNQISSAGSFILGASTLFFLWNVYLTSRRPERVTEDDPWGYANSLEWATSCPPPRHNFTRIPRIRSERPAFDLHYPHIRSGRKRAGAPATHPGRGPAAK
jgi:cytochrome c oxidase subunit 1